MCLLHKLVCRIIGHDNYPHRGGWGCGRCGIYYDCGRKKEYSNYDEFSKDFQAWKEVFENGERWKAAMKLAELASDPICEVDEYGNNCFPGHKCDACQMRELSNIVINIPLKGKEK